MNSKADICEFIWNIEDKYNLFSKTIDGVYFWELLRFRLVQHIYDLKNYGSKTINPDHKSVIKQWVKLSKHLLFSIRNSYLYGTRMKTKQVDILIFEHARKKMNNGIYIDIYTNDFLKKCIKNKCNYEVIESPFQGKHYCKTDSKRRYRDHYYISYFFRKLNLKLSRNRNVIFNKKDIVLLKQLQKSFNNRYDICINFNSLVVNQISQFKIEYDFYYELLQIKNPKQVYIVVGYGQKPLISACKNNSVEVIEFQHGLISRYHMGYSYPLNQKLYYYPDKLYLFGKYWSKNTPLPDKNTKFEYTGFPYFENLVKKKTISKKKNQVVFISQLPVQEQLFEIAYRFAQKNKIYDVFFKFHPKEQMKEKSILIGEKAKSLLNFTLIQKVQADIYDLLSSAEYIVGVYSTSVYEALALKCKPILINLSGIENMGDIINSGTAAVAEDEDDIYEIIKNYTFTSMNTQILFANLNE